MKEEIPRISVVVPTKNRLATLDRAVRSVLEQTVPVAEVVVVDDGSTDGTAEYLRDLALADARVVPIFLATSGGAAAARNIGVARSTGELIAFQDSDDAWRPAFVETLLPAVARRSRVVAFCSHSLHGLDGAELVVPAGRVSHVRTELLYRNPISTQTALVDAALLRGQRAFDPELRRFQDWDLWLHLRADPTVEFVHVDEVLVDVRRMPDSISHGSRTVRAAALRTIFKRYRRSFLRHPRAAARLVARAYLR